MPKALANRLCHLEVKADAASWHQWAVSHGIHRLITGYIDYNPTCLTLNKALSTELAFPTPRSWEMASNILNDVSEDFDIVFPLLVGCIGYDDAAALRTWKEIDSLLPNVEDIFNGQKVEISTKPEFLYALVSSMAAYARSHPDSGGLVHSLDFACELPWEFRCKLFSDYQTLQGIRPTLANYEPYQRWLSLMENR